MAPTSKEEARRRLDQVQESLWRSFWEKADKVSQGLAGRSFPNSADLIQEDRNR